MSTRPATHAAAHGGVAAASSTAAAAHIVTSYPFVNATSNDFTIERINEEYSGIIKIRRLVYIGERCPALSVSAFRSALSALKAAKPAALNRNEKTQTGQPLGPNAQMYVDVLARARELLLTASSQPEHQFFLSAGAAENVASDPLFALDHTFQQTINKSFNDTQQHLENQLMIHRRDGEREQMKVASLNLADFYFNRGELTASLNKYLEAKECVHQHSTPQTNMELLTISLNVIRNSILLLNLSHVKTQVQRAQRLWKEITAAAGQSPTAEREEIQGKIINSKLNAAMGLHHLKGNAYHSAALSFMSVSSDLQGVYSDVLSGRDIAVYGSICALAAFDRKELKEHALNNTEFKKLLDINTPNTWKIILQQFYASNYAKVFEMIEQIKPDLYLDLFLSTHVNRLIKQIRERAFIQYFKAYVSVELRVMSVAFSMDMASLERTLADLIHDNKIAARIDSHKKILYARHADQRNDTFTSALQVGNRYVRDVRAILMRLALVENDIIVRGSESKPRKARIGTGERLSQQEEEQIYRAQAESIMRR